MEAAALELADGDLLGEPRLASCDLAVDRSRDAAAGRRTLRLDGEGGGDREQQKRQDEAFAPERKPEGVVHDGGVTGEDDRSLSA